MCINLPFCCVNIVCCYVGSGVLDSDQVQPVKAQLLGFLLYASPDSIGRLLKAFGSDDQLDTELSLQQILPSPHCVLRCLATGSAGGHQRLYSHREGNSALLLLPFI